MTDTTQSPKSNTREPVAFDERTRRVMELRRQIRAGLYQPDPEEIARAILREWTTLGDELTENAPPPPVGTLADRKAVATQFLVAKTASEAPDSGALTA